MSEFITNDELSFGEMLDQSFKSTYNGKKETGVVVGITPTEVQVDIGTKHTGYVPPVSYTHLPTNPFSAASRGRTSKTTARDCLQPVTFPL